MAVSALVTQFKHTSAAQDPLWTMIRDKSLRSDGPFKLSSGEMSSYLFDMKKTMMDPEGANLIAEEILRRPELANADAIGGLVMGAVPIISVVCAKSYYTPKKIPGFFVRKEAKGHGTRKLIDGYLEPGMRAVMIDDVTTTGGSTLKAVHAARDLGCIVDTVISIVDRLEGATENLAKEGVTLVALYTRSDFGF